MRGERLLALVALISVSGCMESVERLETGAQACESIGSNLSYFSVLNESYVCENGVVFSRSDITKLMKQTQEGEEDSND